MKRVAYEDNGGGLSVVEYSDNGKMVAQAWGAEYASEGGKIADGADVVSCLRGDLTDWSNWADKDNTSVCDGSINTIADCSDPADEPTTKITGEMDKDGEITLCPNSVGHNGRMWMLPCVPLSLKDEDDWQDATDITIPQEK